MSQVKLNGKVALITGANSGIGRETAKQLALQGYHVFITCRNFTKAKPVLDEIDQLSDQTAKAEFIALELSDLNSVKACAENFLSRNLDLHLLIANAGVAGQKGLTQSGFEYTFGVCHVGHFLLFKLLTEKLIQSAPARVVVVASKAHRHAKNIDFTKVLQPANSLGAMQEYCTAKLANVLFVKELSRRLYSTGVTVYAVHPGIVATDIWRSLPKPLHKMMNRFLLTPEQGATTSLHCATKAQLAGESGLYYEQSKVVQSSAVAQDMQLAEQLWEHSEHWVKSYV